MYCGKTAEMIEMPVEMIGPLGPRNGMLRLKSKYVTKLFFLGLVCLFTVLLCAALQTEEMHCRWNVQRRYVTVFPLFN